MYITTFEFYSFIYVTRPDNPMGYNINLSKKFHSRNLGIRWGIILSCLVRAHMQPHQSSYFSIVRLPLISFYSLRPQRIPSLDTTGSKNITLLKKNSQLEKFSVQLMFSQSIPKSTLSVQWAHHRCESILIRIGTYSFTVVKNWNIFFYGGKKLTYSFKENIS